MNTRNFHVMNEYSAVHKLVEGLYMQKFYN